MSGQAQKMGVDFLERAVSMAFGEYAVLTPRLASLYEPEGGRAEHGFVEPELGTDANPLPVDDASVRTVETGPKHPLSNLPRSGAMPAAPVASAPRKSFDHGDADRREPSSLRAQIYPESRLDAHDEFYMLESGLIMEPTMGANDRLMRTVKSGQERPLNETPRPGVAPVFKSVGASGAPIASAPGKTFDHGDADRRVQSSPRVQINHGSRLDARGDVDTLAVELTPGSIPRSVMEPSMGMVDDLPRTNDRSMRTADSDHNHPLRISLQSSATPGFERAGPSAAQQYPSRAQLTADSARPESAVDRAPPQVRSMPDRDETGARHNTTQMLRTLEKSGQLVAQSMKIPAMPEPSVNEARPAEPVIHVSIGRVEIRATQAPNPSRAPRSAPKLMGLDEYLNKRGGRE